MNEEEKRPFNAEQAPEQYQSPSEKLQNEEEPDAPLPGAENPESKEIKKEFNPNTE